MLKVSIVILNWNGKEDTYECINSVYSSDFKNTFEIILIDNGSTDESVDFFGKKLKGFPRLRLIKNKTNLGLAEGMNMGIRNSKSDLVCLLGNDTVVDKHWLSELVSAIKSDKDIAVAGSRIKNLVGYHGEDICGLIINIFFQVVDKSRQYTKSSYASLTSMILKKELFEKDPFIPEYFGNCEDVYFSILARLKGYQIKINPKSYVIHKGGMSVRKIPAIMDFHMDKNTILNFLILYQASTILKLLPVFLILQLFVLLSSVFTGKFVNKIKSYFWVIKNYPLILKYRAVVKKQRRISDKELISSIMSYKLPLKGIIGKFFSGLIRLYLFLVGIKTMDRKVYIQK